MTIGNDRPSPQDAETCSELGRDEQVYDYYNAVLVGDEAREFETHLLECFTCRRKLTTLDWVNATLRNEMMSAALPALADEAEAPAGARAAAETAGHQVPTFYMIVGGLSLLGVLTLVGFNLVGYTRQRHAKRAQIVGQAVG